jgi:hypothetical protein
LRGQVLQYNPVNKIIALYSCILICANLNRASKIKDFEMNDNQHKWRSARKSRMEIIKNEHIKEIMGVKVGSRTS